MIRAKLKRGTAVVVAGLCFGYFCLLGIAADELSQQAQLRAQQRTTTAQQRALSAQTSALAATQSHLCALERAQYEGQLTYTRFLAREFHASKAATARGIADLKVVIGHKAPRCPQ